MKTAAVHMPANKIPATIHFCRFISPSLGIEIEYPATVTHLGKWQRIVQLTAIGNRVLLSPPNRIEG